MATIPLTDSGLKKERKKINDCEKAIAGGGKGNTNIADGGGLTLQRQPSQNCTTGNNLNGLWWLGLI